MEKSQSPINEFGIRTFRVPRLLLFLSFFSFVSIVSFLSPISFKSAFAAPTCSELLSSQPKFSAATIRDLSALRLSLDLAQSKGTDSIVLTSLRGDYDKIEQELVVHLERQNIMTREDLLERIKEEIRKIQSKKKVARKQGRSNRDKEARRRREQERQIENSVIDGTRAVMHRIEPGSFRMGQIGKQIDVKITRPFAMMATPTTQIIWRKIAELANSVFGNRYEINVDPSKYKGDTHPVEQVSYENVQTWLSALNELSTAGEPALVDLIPDHKTGDVYRLPTEAEWEFVLRGRGQYNDTYHFGSDKAHYVEYGWSFDNSDHKTHPVAQKNPILINGRAFYDMNGNVWEWVSDFHESELSGGTDPQGPALGLHRVFRGGSMASDPLAFGSHVREYGKPAGRAGSLGFRFVRN